MWIVTTSDHVQLNETFVEKESIIYCNSSKKLYDRFCEWDGFEFTGIWLFCGSNEDEDIGSILIHYFQACDGDSSSRSLTILCTDEQCTSDANVWRQVFEISGVQTTVKLHNISLDKSIEQTIRERTSTWIGELVTPKTAATFQVHNLEIQTHNKKQLDLISEDNQIILLAKLPRTAVRDHVHILSPCDRFVVTVFHGTDDALETKSVFESLGDSKCLLVQLSKSRRYAFVYRESGIFYFQLTYSFDQLIRLNQAFVLQEDYSTDFQTKDPDRRRIGILDDIEYFQKVRSRNENTEKALRESGRFMRDLPKWEFTVSNLKQPLSLFPS